MSKNFVGVSTVCIVSATEIVCKLYEQDTLLSEYEIVPIQCKTHRMLISQGHLAYFLDSLLAYCFINVKVAVTTHVSCIIIIFFVISYGTLRPSELEGLMVMTTDQLL